MRIAVGGFSLARTRLDPEAHHLHDLFDIWRSAGDEVLLIHPPGGAGVPAAQKTSARREPRGRGVWHRLQSILWGDARRAAEADADLLFIPEPMAPLVSPLPVVATYASRRSRPASLSERIQLATGRAGLKGASALLTFDDLPPIGRATPLVRVMPAFVGPRFRHAPLETDADHARVLGLPPGYCLAFAGSVDELDVVLAAWSWVAGALGDEVLLGIIGGRAASAETMRTSAIAAGVEESVRWVEPVSLESLPALLRGAQALIHAGVTSTGQELRWALACGVPIAGVETLETTAVVGNAGYLIPPLDTRALGAACLTLIVEPEVAEALKRRGLTRAEAYHAPSARQTWAGVFRSILQQERDRRRP